MKTAFCFALAALASVASATYCGVAPVSYSLTDSDEAMGFVWQTKALTVSCAEASTQRRSDALTLRGVAFCQHKEDDVPSVQTTILGEWTNFLATTTTFTCPHDNANLTVAFYNNQASSMYPIKMWYSVTATASGEGVFLGKTNPKQ